MHNPDHDHEANSGSPEEAPKNPSPERSLQQEGVDRALRGKLETVRGGAQELLATGNSSEQPSERMINTLVDESPYTRTDLGDGRMQIERDGQTYTIELVDDKESPTLSQVQELMEEVFGEEEVDPEEILRAAVNGETPWETQEDVQYKVFAIKNADGELVSTCTGGHLDLLDDAGKPTGETTFMVAYAVTSPKARQGGLAREAYISALQDASAEAQAAQKKLGFAVGECTHTSEDFWNRVGWKRMYLKQDDGSYNEFRYTQPALDFDEETGEVAEDAGEAAEHLMIDSFGRQPPSKTQVQQCIDAMYKWCNRWPREAFESDEAYQRQQAYVDQFSRDAAEQLQNSNEAIFLDRPMRERAMSGQAKKTLKIAEHTDADHGNAGEEDF